MSLNIWLALSIFLLLVMWGLMFFRRGIANRIAKHPGLAKTIAIVLVMILVIFSTMPFIAFFFYEAK